MIPVNGKPVISWILDDLLDKGIKEEVVIVLKKEDDYLSEFIRRTYANRMQIQLSPIVKSPSILHSLMAGLERSKFSEIRIILGDTLIKDSFEIEENCIFVQEVEDSYRWCIAKIDESHRVTDYFDKHTHTQVPNYALCGYYHFLDGRYLIHCITQCIAKQNLQMSDVLRRYQEIFPIRAKFVDTWFDFGNIDNMISSKQQLLQSRYFNSLSIDPVLHTITKVSLFDEKLQNELNWYESLPQQLKVLTPRIIGKRKENGRLHLTQEYYGYPTLAELYLYSNLELASWATLLQTVLNIHLKFKEFTGKLSAESISHIYSEKTKQRLAKLRDTDSYWGHLMNRPVLTINGEKLLNLPLLEDWIARSIENLINTSEICIIHGDFCFSNILFDINNRIVRLIDPRGSFGEKGIMGDPRYDMAKLRHSISGCYDYIMADLFEVKENDYSFKLELFTKNNVEQIKVLFDKLLQKVGYDVAQIRFIEALLFISMIPLHLDYPNRQRVMYLTAIQIFNQLKK